MPRRAAIALSLALAGCAGDEPAPATTGTAHSYTVRGLVAALPKEPGGDLALTHEAVPGFVDRSGDRVGMDAMTMPFPLAEGVSLEGLAVGDPVEVTLKVDWEADRPVELTAMRELPAGTRLDIPSDSP